jgi:hypothetical protein
MRLVDDHHVPAFRLHGRRVARSARQGQRGNHHTVATPELIGIEPELPIVRVPRFDAGFRRELTHPLPDERRGDQDQRAPDHRPELVLAQGHDCFDGLTEPHLVGEQRPAAQHLEHAPYGLDLERQGLDPLQGAQAQQVREALGCCSERVRVKGTHDVTHGRGRLREAASDLRCGGTVQMERPRAFERRRHRPARVPSSRRTWRTT